MWKVVAYLREKIFLRKAGLLFDESEKAIDAFSGGIFPFKTTDSHPDDLKTTLTSEPPTSTPTIEVYQVYLNTIHHSDNQD